jgi:hypothetical protein
VEVLDILLDRGFVSQEIGILVLCSKAFDSLEEPEGSLDSSRDSTTEDPSLAFIRRPLSQTQVDRSEGSSED